MTIATQIGGNEWCCDISDLGPSFRICHTQVIYFNGDSCRMELIEVKKDPENDVLLWKYRSLDKTKTLTIFND